MTQNNTPVRPVDKRDLELLLNDILRGVEYVENIYEISDDDVIREVRHIGSNVAQALQSWDMMDYTVSATEEEREEMLKEAEYKVGKFQPIEWRA